MDLGTDFACPGGGGGGGVRTNGSFYLEVLHTILLFRSKTWLVTPTSVKPWGVSTTGL